MNYSKKQNRPDYAAKPTGKEDQAQPMECARERTKPLTLSARARELAARGECEVFESVERAMGLASGRRYKLVDCVRLRDYDLDGVAVSRYQANLDFCLTVLGTAKVRAMIAGNSAGTIGEICKQLAAKPTAKTSTGNTYKERLNNVLNLAKQVGLAKLHPYQPTTTP